MVAVGSWGRLSADEHAIHYLSDVAGIGPALRDDGPGIAFGMGRSYGDECLNPGGTLWNTTGLGRFIAFDAEAGRLTCEAGVLLRDIQDVFVPRGWMLPVTPGTQMITVGGAIANDVHGKNHHAVGSFGDHVRRLTLARTDGQVIACGPEPASSWFAATVGGMGLTGVVTSAELQLQRVPGPWIETESIPFESPAEFFALADASEADWNYTVSWIDCVGRSSGRGIFIRGNSIDAGQREIPRASSRRMPFVPPVSLVNRLSLRPFNTAYYHLHKNKPRRALSHYRSFFYPLDNLLEWNRMYGPRGFYQYQSVISREAGQDATLEMLRAIARSGEGSFLAVLKTFGDRMPPGMLSFPLPGVTLALDFPNNGAATLGLFERLDAIVREAGGRIYAAKDARMPRDLFESGYPRLAEFLPYRDPGISSAMSRRLMGS